MGIAEQLQEMQESLLENILEPERLEALAYYWRRAGYEAKVEWTPSDIAEAQGGAGTARLGAVGFESGPISRIELHKSTNRRAGSSARRRYNTAALGARYIDHFLIDAPESAPTGDLTAKRVEQRKYWLFGPITGYPWSGARLADRLEADRDLNRVLDETVEGRIYIHHDRRDGVIRMTRPHRSKSLQNVGTSNEHGIVLPEHVRAILDDPEQAVREYNFPSPEAMKAYQRIAQHIRQAAGMPAA